MARTAADAIVSLRSDGTRRSWNPVAQRIFGPAEVGGALGRPLAELGEPVCEARLTIINDILDFSKTEAGKLTRFRVMVTHNGLGIVRQQIPPIFAKLLYGSKFHRLRMSRGQQGIGISAAGMDEIKRMLSSGLKHELDALANKDFQYLTRTYRPRKLRAQDWMD